MRRRGTAMAVALAFALGPSAACTGDDASSHPDLSDPGGALPDLSGDAVPILPAQVGDLTLGGLAPRPDWPLSRHPMVVTEVEGVIVAVVAEPLALEGIPDRQLDQLGSPGPHLPDGRPTRASVGGGWFRTGTTLTAEDAAEPGTIVIASTSSDDPELLDLLVTVLSEASLPLTEPGAVPGEAIGALGEGENDAWHVHYHGGLGGPSFTIEEVSPSAQAALRALVHPEPSETIDPRTAPSCCPDGVLEPMRELDGPRPGFVAALSPYERILVLEGDPGVALRTVSGVGVADDDLIAIGLALDAGTTDDRDALRADALERRREAQVRAVQEQEETRGWKVVGRADFDEAAVVISAGAGPRGHPADGNLRLCAVVAAGDETCLSAHDLRPGSVAGLPLETIVYVPPADVASARVEVLDSSWSMQEVELEATGELPARLFVLRIAYEELPAIGSEPLAVELVATSSDGAELERISLLP